MNVELDAQEVLNLVFKQRNDALDALVIQQAMVSKLSARIATLEAEREANKAAPQ